MDDTLLKNRALGSLIGLAIGDALGTTLEFQSRPKEPIITDMVGGGVFNLKPGQWTDDTSMMLCLADSLINCNSFDPTDQMKRYIDWRDNGYQSCTGSCFDIGMTVSHALNLFEETGVPFAGSTKEYTAGNGSLMRVAPIALFSYKQELSIAIHLAEMSSKTTHGEKRCIDACCYMIYLIHTLLNNKSINKNDLLLSTNYELAPYLRIMHKESIEVIQGSYKDKKRNEIKSSGFVIDSLEAALWCFWNSQNFYEGVLLAANLGDDSDTVAAIYGQLAGAYYGYKSIPDNWKQSIAWNNIIINRALLLIKNK